MNIEFNTTKLAKACSSDKAMRRNWSPEMARKLQQRLADLEAATTLADMSALPGGCHELRGDRAGCVAIALVQPYRLIFRPNHAPLPTKPDGGLDRARVTSILIEDVVDYH